MKMISVVFLLFVGLRVSSANFLNDCNPGKCLNLSPFEELREVRFLPNKEELQRICPGVSKFIDCEFDNVKDCNGIGIEELAMSSNATIAAFTSMFLNIASLSADLCDENTLIHQEYIEHLDCLREFFTKTCGMECFKESRKLARGFYDSLSVSEDDVDSEQFTSCVTVPLEIACAAHRLQKRCGQLTRSTFVNIIRRMQHLVHPDCKAEDFGALKSAFFEYAKLDDEQQEAYRSVLDVLLKRRR
ncbi:uncharacterized protein TNIN_112601 [Trichonephila inaurata madagascariensis]|uniref:Uncharacterized protein n=1 Tax=Trichonephila inaurata madagascariensis TaxID=2747483 RepID=A0A8X7C1J7_9ARAC|nr:uncharacterized protein TNIN_112601 [Trichonephila inaurata madagascariensis]